MKKKTKGRELFFAEEKKLSMEAIKAKIHTTVTASVGPCTVRIIPSDRCIVITLDAHPRHLIFVQPDR